MAKYYLPSKLGGYLTRLAREYSRTDRQLQLELIEHCRYLAIEDTDGDAYNDAVGHDARLYLPLDIHEKISLGRIGHVADGICEDLNHLAIGVRGEYFRAVALEIEDEADGDYQRAQPYSQHPIPDPDQIGIWVPGLVRLFISHRDAHKKQANELAAALELDGISSFVAHDTIRPRAQWRAEIMKGLQTMEVLLAFVTDDFESAYTNQEVGFALGKGVPVVSLKLGKMPPPGFLSEEQAVRGHLDNPSTTARTLYPHIAAAVGKSERMQSAVVASFAAAPDYDAARVRFESMKANISRLTDEQVETIADGFFKNENLHDAYYLTNHHKRLTKFLQAATGEEFVIDGRLLTRLPDNRLDDDVPF